MGVIWHQPDLNLASVLPALTDPAGRTSYHPVQ